MEYLKKLPNWNTKKILCVRLDRIGDLIVSTPILHALRTAFPQAQIDMLASSLNAPVLKYSKDIDNVYVYDKKRPHAFFFTWMKLQQNKYDVIFCLTSAAKTSAFIVKYIKAPVKVAFMGENKVWKNVYTHIIPEPDMQLDHVLEVFQEQAKVMGLDIPDMHPILTIPEDIREKMNLLYPKSPQSFRLVFFIGNIKKGAKSRWPAEKYAELIEPLYKESLKKGYKLELVIMAGLSDMPLLKAFAGISKEYYSVYVGKDIYETGAFLGQANLLVCSSSGPTHIASAVDCPILSLISMYNVRIWLPLGKNDTYITVPDEFKDPNEEDDLSHIPREEVYSAIQKYIEEWE